MIIRVFLLSFTIILLTNCSVNRLPYGPNKKYSSAELNKDYTTLRTILEKNHPALYWYTSRDSMNMYFSQYQKAIEDSMTELQFGWKVLAPLTNKIRCGHTSFGMSKKYIRWTRNKRFSSFPLYMKVWNDTMVVTANLNRKDSIFRRGTIITAINDIRNKDMIKELFSFMTEDGYADNVNYARLSSNFPYYHRNIFGLSRQYKVEYLDSAGIEHTAYIPLFDPPRDTARRNLLPGINKKRPPELKTKRNESIRSMTIDTTLNTAIITLNGFSNGKLRSFFKESFHSIRKNNINNVILDLRSNGGGKMALSTLLTRYVTRRPFKIADTSYAVSRSLGKNTRYIKGNFLNNLGLFFFTRKKKDGLYHFIHWERKTFHPKTNNHYNGDLYVLTAGPTFSASALFCNDIKGQPGIFLGGEETGGGWHGNSGIIIPEITLPNTHLRVRLPLFKLVQSNHIPKNGHGIMPDIPIGIDYQALVKGIDKKMEVVRQIISKKQTAGLRRK